LTDHQGNVFQFAVALPFDSETFTNLEGSVEGPTLKGWINQVLRTHALTKGEPCAWFLFSQTQTDSPFILNPSLIQQVESQAGLSTPEWNELWRNLRHVDAGGDAKFWILDSLSAIVQRFLHPPNVSLIPAIRRIDKGKADKNEHSGIGLIDKLALLQNPPISAQSDKKRFDHINKFLKSVIGNSSAQLEVPYERDSILVHMDGRTLPLTSLGTGIHEVTILAAAATVLKDRVICIEELELHLHPLLQKKLIRYLEANTENQYFITTHSAHLLDTPGASIFHVRHQNGSTTVERVESPSAKSQVCVDLGYRASDLLQANCIVWVEGPSDRLYLKHWIATSDSELKEGVHYSIMFYGGRLLSHLSADDPEVTDFISLRRLNRFISILIDSDKAHTRAQINATKRRVRDEFNAGPGFAWVTKGREIENYIPPNVIEKAVHQLYKDVRGLVSSDPFSHVTHYKKLTGRKRHKADKVKLAHEVVKEQTDFSCLDLKKMVDRVISFIREANDV
jgi:hypothetical protein